MNLASGLFLSGTVLVMGCAFDPATEDLAGRWVAPFDIPGSSYHLVLDERDGHLTGQGCYAGEAGPQGTLTVTGTRAGAAVTLEITRHQVLPVLRPPEMITVVARLTDRDHLSDGHAFNLARVSSGPSTC